jgi:hypothetical protein
MDGPTPCRGGRAKEVRPRQLAGVWLVPPLRGLLPLGAAYFRRQFCGCQPSIAQLRVIFSKLGNRGLAPLVDTQDAVSSAHMASF